MWICGHSDLSVPRAARVSDEFGARTRDATASVCSMLKFVAAHLEVAPVAATVTALIDTVTDVMVIGKGGGLLTFRSSGALSPGRSGVERSPDTVKGGVCMSTARMMAMTSTTAALTATTRDF